MTGRLTTSVALAAIVTSLAFGGTAAAQTPTEQDHAAHHPSAATAQTAPTTAAPSLAQHPEGGMPGMGGQDMPMPGRPQGGMPGMMGGDMSRMMEMMHRHMVAQAVVRPLEHIDGQLAFYRAELHITDAQQPQWNAFADAFRAAANTLREAVTRATQGGGHITAPDLLQRRIALLSAQLEVLRSVEAAGRPLYAALSDEQKRAADQLMAEHFQSMRGMAP